MSKSRAFFWFAVMQLLICAFVFRDALWGGSLLAPLDLASNLYSKFRYMDPAATGVPANHQVSDQLAFDLPVQYTIYHALRRGEIAWWDPYTAGGWPMLADAHANGFDLTRLVMMALSPFELAYNWGRIVHFVLCGLGMFLLLRRFGFGDATCVLLAGAYECAGWLSYFFMHPYIESAFLWYPFLWLAWDSAFRQGRLRYTAVAALLVAGIVYSGTIQMHTYLGLFALALGIGYAGRSWAEWKRWISPVLISGVLGVCLAAPVVLGQIELFLLSDRQVEVAKGPITWLSGAASLTGVYPWCLGTFRTLDLSKFLEQYMLGFRMFFGSAAAVLAVMGVWCKTEDSRRAQVRRAAFALTVTYFVILSTPLLHIFYVRCAPLAGMGLTVLAAHGLETLARSRARHRRAGWAVAGLAAALALSLNIAAWIVYPRVLPRVRELMAHHDQNNVTFDSAPMMRAHQVEVLPREISFQNPVAVLAWLGLAGLAVWLWRPQWRQRPRVGAALLALNLVPVVMVAQEYIPRQPIGHWQRMLAAGPEQQRLIANLAGTPFRLWDVAPGAHDMVMPFMLPQLYRVRAVHSYTSLYPHSLLSLPVEEQMRLAPQMADRIYESRIRGQPAGELRTNATPGLARFQWTTATERRFTVEDVGLCEMRLKFEPGAAGRLLWTDTYYPGWQVWLDGQRGQREKREPCFSVIEVPASAQEMVLRYRPTYLLVGLVVAWGSASALLVLGIMDLRRSRI